MSNSLFLARLIGPVLLVAGIAVFINRSTFRALGEEFMASRALLFLSGLLIMPVGLAIILTHNVWSADWRVAITILGWLSAVGGAVRLIAPDLVLRKGRAMLAQPHFVSLAPAIWVAIGLLLCFFGYLQ